MLCKRVIPLLLHPRWEYAKLEPKASSSDSRYSALSAATCPSSQKGGHSFNRAQATKNEKKMEEVKEVD